MPVRSHNRRPLRLSDHDYRTPGAYFVTICTYERAYLFDDPVLHGLVTEAWAALPARFPSVALDDFVIMPNHIHGIIWLSARQPEPEEEDRTRPALGEVVRVLKSSVAVGYIRWIKEHDPNRSAHVWQRNYYEHVIRDERELEQIRGYIRDNPARWAADRDNLDALIGRMQEQRSG